MAELITYQTFAVLEDAVLMAEKLEDYGIPTEISKKTAKLDAVFIGNDYVDGYDLKILPDSFNDANAALLKSAGEEPISDDHPLHNMSNNELQTVVAAPDEWGADNYIIALQLLKKRGILLTQGAINEMHGKRMENLAKPKSIASYILLLGYASAILPLILNILKAQPQKIIVVCYLPGLIGVIIGSVILQSKKTLPDGKRVPVYDSRSLKHGLIILVLNIISWIINSVVLYTLSYDLYKASGQL